MSARALRTGERGMTLVEVMIAGLIMVVGVLGVVAMIDAANGTTKRTRAREAGTNLAREVVEAARGIGFAELSPATLQSRLQASEGLAGSGGGATWTIERRGTEYEVAASVCSMDDPQDGMGTRPTGVSWCPDVGPAGNADFNGTEDYKRITVTVTWEEAGRERTIRQSSLVNNSDTGPRVTFTQGPVPADSGSGQITGGATQSVRFNVSVSQAANRVEWYLDGTYVAQARRLTSTTYDFTWDLGVAPCAGPAGTWDGNYFVSAQAFNQVGDSPGPRVRTVTVNRCAPITPTIDRGGRNLRPSGNVIEVEWEPNPERDIIGYRVYRAGVSARQAGSTAAWASGQECAGRDQFDATSCVFDDPAPGTTLLYQVVAVDRAPDGSERESPVRSLTVTASGANTPPGAPRSLTRTRLTNGDIRLDWQQPSGNDAAFYRIYRGGTELRHRYDEGTAVSYTDADPNGDPYYVVAVDAQFSEGAVAGPVSP